MEHNDPSLGTPIEVLLLILFGLLIVFYIFAGWSSSRKEHLRTWPIYRYILWIFGILSALTAIIGPLANRAHHDFTAHMTGHLLIGMLAPLLMALSAPLTLLLRTLPVKSAKVVTQLLRTVFIKRITHPIVASILNIGGLWVLYTTDLFAFMHNNILLFLFIHFHVFMAGYVFTIAMIYVDPVAHRYSYIFRSVVLILALSGHAMLSKYIYANPPLGVLQEQAETGAMIMYYGGDCIDVILIFILCYQWYISTKPRESFKWNPSA
ncbi:cytochrome c oxidase assembly protein [Oceanobacillus salinisoli]|uniref:cytochrome c oxidase assembly protein n=1 Tax=Oceanobacillus salinisoli TaxID=2678611 RepID=UPI0012E18FD9|nr:cytochrome c oxidase assembly protein [Oceanobacillus salinisoli]